MLKRRLWRTPPPTEVDAQFDEAAGSCHASLRRPRGYFAGPSFTNTASH